MLTPRNMRFFVGDVKGDPGLWSKEHLRFESNQASRRHRMSVFSAVTSGNPALRFDCQ